MADRTPGSVPATVEAVARALFPDRWLPFDLSIAGLRGEACSDTAFWKGRLVADGCKTEADAHKWWFGGVIASKPYAVTLILESLWVAERALAAIPTSQPDDLTAAAQLERSGLITREKYNHICENIRARDRMREAMA